MDFEKSELAQISHESTFLRIIRINEGIKRISDLSFGIRLRAINTLIFASKHQGERSGIPVIASEMIKFSLELEDRARETTGIAHEMLGHITFFTKRDQLQQYFEKISTMLYRIEKPEAGNAVIKRIREVYRAVQLQTFDATANGMKSLFAGVNQLLRYCMTGRVLGTMTRIESARAGKDRAYFMKLADDFRFAIRETEDILKVISEIDRDQAQGYPG